MIRSGQSPSAVLNYLRQTVRAEATICLHESSVGQNTMRLLLNSQSPLSEILRCIKGPRSQGQPPTPIQRCVKFHQDQFSSLDTSQDDRAEPFDDSRIAAAYLRSSKSSSSDESHVETLYQVPARPWTEVVCDDALVSHLVSIFLIWLNPPFRFVDPLQFLKDIRSRNLYAKCCSPLLVNSILAYASVGCPWCLRTMALTISVQSNSPMPMNRLRATSLSVREICFLLKQIVCVTHNSMQAVQRTFVL